MKSLQTQQILFVIIVFLGKAYLTVTPTGVECYFNEEYCAPTYCFLTKGRGKSKYLSTGCNFIQPLASALISVEILRRTKEGTYTNMNLKVETSLCKLGDVKGANGIINNLMGLSMKSLSRLKCPLQGNVTITRMPLMIFLVQGLLPMRIINYLPKFSGALNQYYN